MQRAEPFLPRTDRKNRKNRKNRTSIFIPMLFIFVTRDADAQIPSKSNAFRFIDRLLTILRGYN